MDIRFSARLLMKERWFSISSIGALALGIAVTAMIVTIINGYNLRGLPVADPDRVMFVGTRDQSNRDRGVSYSDYLAWRRARGFASMGAFADATLTIGETGLAPESVGGAYVSHDAFAILGEQPVLGRGFQPDDDRADAPPVVLLGHRIWATRYASDRGVIGQAVTVNGTPATVIGVMHERFEFPYRHGAWMPLAHMPGLETRGGDEPSLGVFGRLASGVHPDQARDELAALSANVARQPAATPDRIRPVLVRFGVQQVGRIGDQQPPLAALGTAVVVLLIACANVASLLLARSAGRGREIAIRASIGATRWRIVRQLMVESLMLSVLASALGIWLSRAGVAFVAQAFGRNTPYWMHFPVDGRVLAVLAGLCVACTIAFGLGPALAVSRTDAAGAMRDGGRTGLAPRVRRWTQALLIAEIAVTVTLLAGAGLLVRSVLAVYQADRVLDPRRVMTMGISLPEAKYGTPEQRSAFYRDLDDRLVRSTGSAVGSLAGTRPFVSAPSQHVWLQDAAEAGASGRRTAAVIAVGPRYFEALQVPVLRGRSFTAADGGAGQPVAIVNQRFVELILSSGDPIGRTIRLTDEKGSPAAAPWLTIVGVTPTIRQSVAGGTRPVVYLPLSSHTSPRASIVVGRLADPREILPVLRRDVAAIDPDVTLFNARPLTELLDDSRLQPRLIGTIIAAFAGIALLLSVVGLYAFTAYSVHQRTHEIGVRMALGARPAQVVWLMVKRGLLPLAIGVGVGLLGGFGAGQVLRSLLIQTSPTDPVTLASIAVLLIAVSIVACLLPARKAAHLDPLVVLRNE